MKKISKYQLFTELQQGPVARVYKAIQSELQRIVLVKQLNPDLISDTELVERFKQEGLILAKINSPHVITIFDFGVDEGVPFLVTEFVEGSTLSELIEKYDALPWDISLFVLQQIALGLKAIHQQRIIHQDIKPANIFISHQGEAKLGDLGFSTSLEQAAQQIQGTPAYLPPEVIEGATVDFRSDLYSLGLVGYEMLTGENPFAANEMQTVFNRIVNLKPMQIHTVKSEVPAKLSAIISKLMAHHPDDRFQAAKDLYQELENFKISKGIKVDGNCLINFLQHPDQYQLSQVIANKHPEPSIQKLKKRKLPVLTAGIILMIGILIVFLSKLRDYSLSVLPEKTDTTRTAIEQNFFQATNQHEIPIDTEQKSTTVGTKKSKEYMDNSRVKSVIKDTLKLLNIVPFKQDTMVITSDPRAWIFKNGESLGVTPLAKILDSKNEPIELELRAPGFPVIKKTVPISEQTAHNIHINLWQEVGYLDIDITPWGEIWIDGDSIDVSPINRPLILAHGKHRLMVRHPSLKSITDSICVAEGETLKKTIQLQRVP